MAGAGAAATAQAANNAIDGVSLSTNIGDAAIGGAVGGALGAGIGTAAGNVLTQTGVFGARGSLSAAGVAATSAGGEAFGAAGARTLPEFFEDEQM